MRLKKSWPLFIVVVSFVVYGLCWYFNVIINVTPSMKYGFYLPTHGIIKRNDLVATCLPEPYKTIGLKQGYILPNRKCHGAELLIKQIWAVPGDELVLTDEGFSINGKWFYLKTERVDRHNRALLSYPRGRYTITGYWLIGNNSDNSWDSRYWGTIDRKNILYKVSPMLVWS